MSHSEAWLCAVSHAAAEQGSEVLRDVPEPRAAGGLCGCSVGGKAEPWPWEL